MPAMPPPPGHPCGASASLSATEGSLGLASPSHRSTSLPNTAAHRADAQGAVSNRTAHPNATATRTRARPPERQCQPRKPRRTRLHAGMIPKRASVRPISSQSARSIHPGSAPSFATWFREVCRSRSDWAAAALVVSAVSCGQEGVAGPETRCRRRRRSLSRRRWWPACATEPHQHTAQRVALDLTDCSRHHHRHG